MNALSRRVFAVICLASLSGCVTSPSASDWRRLDDGSFTIDIPKRLEKQHVVFLRTRGSEYSCRDFRLDFDESTLGYMKESYELWHKEFEAGYRKQEGVVIGTQFFLKLGNQYAKVTVGTNDNWEKLHNPGKYMVGFICPNSNGSCLDIWMSYGNDKDTDTAMRIVKSVQFK